MHLLIFVVIGSHLLLYIVFSHDILWCVAALRGSGKKVGDRNGNPKDWQTTDRGNVRITHPSNLWTDISIPFWSMPENTDHPTQKPEKLIAKIILASSRPCDMVFDPFLGSGTTSVVAKKLGRHYVGIEMDEEYACIAEKRLDLAHSQPKIQGYDGEYFWERNSLSAQQKARKQKGNR